MIITVEQNLLIPVEIILDKEKDSNIKNDDIYFDYRKELQTIYQNFFSIKCIKPIILQSIEYKFETLLKDYFSCSLQDIELPIQLLSIIRDNIKENEDTSIFKEFIVSLFKIHNVIKSADIKSETVILLYFETITKYIFIFAKDQDTIKAILVDIFFGVK